MGSPICWHCAVEASKCLGFLQGFRHVLKRLVKSWRPHTSFHPKWWCSEGNRPYFREIQIGEIFFLLSANKSQLFLDPALDHVDSTNDFLFTVLGIRLPRLREQDMRELSLLFKGVQAPMLDALARHIGNFQLDGLVPADMVMAGCIRGGAPNRIYLPMMPRMNDGAPLPPLFTERLRAACQSPLNSNSVLALLCLSCSLLVFCGLHVSFLRAFGRARKLTGSDSPIFTTFFQRLRA